MRKRLPLSIIGNLTSLQHLLMGGRYIAELELGLDTLVTMKNIHQSTPSKPYVLFEDRDQNCSKKKPNNFSYHYENHRIIIYYNSLFVYLNKLSLPDFSALSKITENPPTFEMPIKTTVAIDEIIIRACKLSVQRTCKFKAYFVT